MDFAVKSGVHFNVDDHSILDRLFSFGIPQSLCFRVNIGSKDEAGLLNFSGDQSKFGILPEHLYDAAKQAIDAGVSRISLHMMPGSCRLDESYFVENATMLVETALLLTSELNVPFDFLDLGGGIGIPYNDKEKAINIDRLFKNLKKTIETPFKKRNIALPTIVMEPARYFVGNAGYLVGSVNSIKDAAEPIICTDLSMNTMVRTVLYKTKHRIVANGKMHDDKERAGLCGQVCENTDYYIKNDRFPSTIATGDLLVMRDVGAYGYSMSYDYNGRVMPAEVLVDGAGHRLIRRRKTYDDLLSLVEGDDWRSASTESHSG